MGAVNRFGLSRDIPEPVRREVRQRCGFGCVVCGMAVCQYEHIEPEFADAERHDPAAITLLCGRCHDKVTRGLLSKETVKLANAAPKALQKGFSFETFDIGPVHPDVRLGPLLAVRPHTIIRAFGEDLFGVAEPEQPGGPFRLSAVFADREGRETLRITDNTWETPTDNWDVDVTGPRITLRKGLGDLILQLRVAPPKELVIERLDMHFRGLRIVVDEKSGFSIETPHRRFFQTHNMTLDDCEVVFDVQEDGEFTVGCNCAEDQYIEEFRFGPLPPGMSATGFRQNHERRTDMTISIPKMPRNARCPCGSGRKYKHCHGKPS
jgi:hypothetical protein